MTLPDMHPSRPRIIAVLLSCSALVGGAAIAGTPVTDRGNIAETRQLVTSSENQVVELGQIKDLEQQQLNSIGQFGSLGSLFGGTSMANVGSQSDFYANMQKFAFDPCAVNLCQIGDDPVGTTDLEEARDWAYENFFAGDPIEPSAERDLREIRRRGVVNASVNAVALTTITHNDLAGAGAQADALETLTSSSQDLRGDVRANSAIALAAYKIELQQLAILTSLLEVEATGNISAQDIYHELGGTEFADAFIEADFAANNRSIRINVTPPEQGSAGGSGLGGALMDALGGASGGGAARNVLSKNGTDTSALTGSISGLVAKMNDGSIPSVSSDKVDMFTVSADATSVAKAALDGSEPRAISPALGLVGTGLSTRGEKGGALSILGLAQIFAASSGNDRLSAALNTASIALSDGSAAAATNFAEGSLRDLRKSGVVGEYADHIRNGIAAVRNGSMQASDLILDTAAIYATLGADANQSASSILQRDPTALSGAYLKSMLADAIDSIAALKEDPDLERLAADLRAIDSTDVAALRSRIQSR